MVKVIVSLLLLQIGLVGCDSRQKGEDKSPNIILIMIDDMGWKDFGEAGSTYYQTPHIDKLSIEGIRFTK